MSPNHRPRTWKELRDRPSQTTFIGREAQLQAFRSTLSTLYEQRTKFIFNVSGQGGIGKTTLLKQFRKIAEDSKQAVAYVDEGAQSNRVDNVPEALDRLAADLEMQGHAFTRFRERYKVYRQKRQELEADPDAPQGFVAGLGRVVAKASFGAAKSIPGSGAVLDFVDTNAMADKTGEIAAFVARKITNKDEIQLINEPLEVLTPLFLADLNRIAEKQTVVLLLDTYEQTAVFWDDWVRSLLTDRYGDVTPNFLLAIAGRDPLSRNGWTALEDWMLRSELEPFTPEEARQYFTSKDITCEAVIQEIWRLSSGGLPLLIGMMAQAAPTNPNAITDHCEDAVERFLKWETDPAKRQMAMDAALPRVLNRDVLARLVADADVKALFEWLKSRSFVVEHPEGWQYHSVVRDQMLRYQRKVSPQGWADLHGKWATYYDQLRQRSGLAMVTTATNQPTVTERLTTQQAGLQADWDLKNEKLRQLRHDLAIETDTATKFKLQHDINAEETQLAQLTTQLNALEQALERDETTPTALAPSEANQLWAEPKERWQDESWQKYTLEWLYHSLCIAPQAQLGMALNLWLVAIQNISIELINKFPEVILRAGRDTGASEVQFWGNRLHNAWAERNEEDTARFCEVFESLENSNLIEPDLKSLIIFMRGVVYMDANQTFKAIGEFRQVSKMALPAVQKEHVENLRVLIDSENLRPEEIGRLTPQVLFMAALGICAEINTTLGHYSEALQESNLLIKLVPDSTKLIADRGEIYRKMERYDEALIDFNRAIELVANNAWVIASRGQTYRALKRYNEAIQDFNRAIELDPDSAWKLANRGETYRSMERYEDALTDFNRAIALDANDAWAITKRGQTYRALKQHDEAIQDFSRAIELDPDSAWKLANRGETHRLMERYEEALADFDGAIKIDANYALALRIRGEIYLLKGQVETALQDLTQAITLDPKDDWCFYTQALAYLKLNQLQLAQTGLATAIQLAQPKYEQSPTDWQNTFNLALYHLAANHVGTADALYRQSLIAPKWSCMEATTDLQDFLTLFPDHAQAQQIVALLQSTLESEGNRV